MLPRCLVLKIMPNLASRPTQNPLVSDRPRATLSKHLSASLLVLPSTLRLLLLPPDESRSVGLWLL